MRQSSTSGAPVSENWVASMSPSSAVATVERTISAEMGRIQRSMAPLYQGISASAQGDPAVRVETSTPPSVIASPSR